jgi:hypothetical protein
MENRQLDIVVAHYNEDLSWLEPFASKAIVYSKGAPPECPNFARVITLDNIGRESHTFLYHLVHSYDDLADITMFVQGDVYNLNNDVLPHTALSVPEMIYKSLNTSPVGVTSFGPLKKPFYDWSGLLWAEPGEIQWLRRLGSTMVPARMSPAKFWEFIHGEGHPPGVQWHAGGLFAVRAENVRRRPRDFYHKIFKYFEEPGFCSIEEGHYMERMWFAIFSDTHIIRGGHLTSTLWHV